MDDSYMQMSGFVARRIRNGALVCGIGPSLENAGISNALSNPTLDLRAANGVARSRISHLALAHAG